MKDVVVNSTVDYIEKHGTKVNDVQFDNICRDVNVHFNMAYLPKVAYSKLLDLNKSGSKFQILSDEFYNIVNTNKSIMLNRKEYMNNVFISSYLIGRYISDSIIKDTRIHKILYVDTPLLLADYKKMMDINDNINPPVLTHHQEVLNKNIYDYDYVIWDRFNCASSYYDLNKLQEIVHCRYLNMCGNMFFCIGDTEDERVNGIDTNLLSSMNITDIYNLELEECSCIEISDGGNI